jgi:hypothetical protein
MTPIEELARETRLLAALCNLFDAAIGHNEPQDLLIIRVQEIRDVGVRASRALAALSEPTKGMSTAEIDAGMMAEASLADACAKVDWGYYGVTEEERAEGLRLLAARDDALRAANNNPHDDDWTSLQDEAFQAECKYHNWMEAHAARLLSPTLRAQSVPEGWRETVKELPKKPGLAPYEYVECLIVVYGEIEIGNWNCEHLCWDDEQMDDFKYDALKPSHWMPLPALPTPPTHQDPAP